ncbi:hypothetical protein JRQ81_019578, partial [Phrynocephalus forsythii]
PKGREAIISKILSLGLSQDLLFTMNYDQAKVLIKQRVTNSERQLHLASSPAFIINDSCRDNIGGLPIRRGYVPVTPVVLSQQNRPAVDEADTVGKEGVGNGTILQKTPQKALSTGVVSVISDTGAPTVEKK